jgi:hypothetical protein
MVNVVAVVVAVVSVAVVVSVSAFGWIVAHGVGAPGWPMGLGWFPAG